MINIIFFAHGTTTDNENRISSGWADAKLSDSGIEQGVKLKSQIDISKFDVVFCSDLSRSAESAKLTFDGVCPIVQDSRLRECNYGDFNGMPSEIVEPKQAMHITERFPEGENYEDVKNRMEDFLAYLKQNYDSKTIGIVGHKATQFALEALLGHKSWEQVFAEDWRLKKNWQPGWHYSLK